MHREVYLVRIIMDTGIVDLAACKEQTAPAVEAAGPGAENSLLRWFELALVLLVAFGDLFLNHFNFLGGFVNAFARGRGFSSGNIWWTIMLLREIPGLLLLAFVLRRQNLRIRDLGLRWSTRDLATGGLVAAVSYGACELGYFILSAMQRLLFGTMAHRPNELGLFGHTTVMMAVFSLVNPFFEELIVRAYLMTEVKALTGSWTLAALLSTAVQTSYHLYYGWTMALALGCQFLVFSIYYARFRKATPLVFAHGVFDWIGVIQLL
jgi:Type II CAAX prenyl endopeptidase Rce1-like